MRTIGSQSRETLQEANMRIKSRLSSESVVLQSIESPEERPELWIKNDDYAGYVIEIDGAGYEFVGSV